MTIIFINKKQRIIQKNYKRKTAMNEWDYVYEVYKERSFSAAAKNLFVSQPALSTAVKKLEESLGITIFDRSGSPLSLTEAGKVYIAALEEIRAIDRRMREQLADLSALQSGHIVVGGENFVTSFVLPPIIKKFLSRYGGIEVELVENNSPDLRKLLLTENLDLLIAHDFDTRFYTALPLFEESLFLAVPEGLAVNKQLGSFALSKEQISKRRHRSPDCPAVDLKEFREENFLILKQGNDMHRRANVLCEDAGFEPKVLLSPNQLITSYNMACSGMGIAFVTDALISAASGEGCVFYRLDGMHTTRTMSIGFKRNRYLSSACSAFIETAKKTFG